MDANGPWVATPLHRAGRTGGRIRLKMKNWRWKIIVCYSKLQTPNWRKYPSAVMLRGLCLERATIYLTNLHGHLLLAAPTGIEPVWFVVNFLLSDSQVSTPVQTQRPFSSFKEHFLLISAAKLQRHSATFLRNKKRCVYAPFWVGCPGGCHPQALPLSFTYTLAKERAHRSVFKCGIILEIALLFVFFLWKTCSVMKWNV